MKTDESNILNAHDEYRQFRWDVENNFKTNKDAAAITRTSDIKFLQSWSESIIPICMQDSFSLPIDCADFMPSFTNEGLGFTRNNANLDIIYQPSAYMNDFKKTMLFNRNISTIRRIKGSGINHQYSFLINANRYKDLKRGVNWNRTARPELKLALHSPFDIPDIKGIGVQIYPGYLTTIRVNTLQLKSNEHIRGLDIKKRQCKFADERQGLKIVKRYSRINCLFECSMDVAENTCGCRPWDYPRENSSTRVPKNNRICDFFGSSCFNKLMKKDYTEEQCRKKCTSDCNEIKYSLSVDQSPLESQEYVCVDPTSKDVTTKENVQNTIWRNMFGDPIHGNEVSWFKLTNTDRMVRIVQDALTTPNQTTKQKDFCVKKVSADIAVVEVIINSPTVLRLIQSVKVSFVEKLANFGKLL